MTRGILFTKDKICIFKRIVDRVMKDKKTEAYELFLKALQKICLCLIQVVFSDAMILRMRID